MFCSSYKWNIDHIVKALLVLSESSNAHCQQILVDLLASLLLLLSGEPNHKFDQHIRIVQYFLAQVLRIEIWYKTSTIISIFLQSSLIILKKHEGWIYLKNLKCSPLLVKSTTLKIFKVILKNMLMADVDFHLDIAYEQYRLYTTPDSVCNMLITVLLF